MIYIVEIPHRLPAACWTARDESDVIDVASRDAQRSGEDINSFDDAIQWLANDLHNFAVFTTADAAVAALDSHPIFSGHQGARAEGALRKKLIRDSAIAAPAEDDDES
jgi:hypothetical protein